MPILSLQNPLGYVIIVLLICVAYVLYRIATKKEQKQIPNNFDMSDPDIDYDTTNVPNTNVVAPSIPSDTGKLKRFGIKKIIKKYFPNGSSLAVMNDGRLIRTKAKYC